MDPGVWIGLGSLALSIITGAIIMAWKLGGLNSTVDSMSKQLDVNTQRLDVIDAKADAATATAQAATSAVAVITATSRRRREDYEQG